MAADNIVNNHRTAGLTDDAEFTKSADRVNENPVSRECSRYFMWWLSIPCISSVSHLSLPLMAGYARPIISIRFVEHELRIYRSVQI